MIHNYIIIFYLFFALHELNYNTDDDDNDKMISVYETFRWICV